MNLRVISRNVGFALLVSALFMFISMLISLWDGSNSAFTALTISFILTFVFGVFPFIFVRKSDTISLKDGFMIVVLSWLLSFVFGMLPYALWGSPFSVVDAWFESVSGFTATGATILEDVESLPRSLLFWRSSTHFIGGLGVVVFLLLVIPSSSQIRFRLTNMELSSLSKSGYKVRTNKTVFVFASVYIALFLLAFVSYVIAGMSVFDALNHAMSVCATGGFSTKNASIAAFNSPAIEILTIVFMYLSSLHFGLLFLTVVNRSFKPLNNPAFRFFTLTLILASIATAISIKLNGNCESWGRAFLDGTFQIVSYATTAGFATADNSQWPLFVCVLMLLVGTVCGMAGSTTGGLKSDRVLLLAKSFPHQLRNSLRPSSVHGIRYGGTYLSDAEVYPQIMYIAHFILLIMLSMLLSMMTGLDSADAVSGTISTFTNVGPAIGDIGSMGNFEHIPSGAKIIFSINMFLGRVEIYPVMAVLMSIFLDRRR